MGTAKEAARQALVGLVGSKKAWTAVMSSIAAGLLRLGFEVDANTVGLILTPLVGLIIGQGVADHGKERKGDSVVQVVEESRS